LTKLIEKVKIQKLKVGVRRQFNKDDPPVFEKETDFFEESVLLPTFSMVGEISGPDNNRRVDILVPDDEAEEIGKSGKFRLVKEKIKKKYRGQKWDNDDPLEI